MSKKTFYTILIIIGSLIIIGGLIWYFVFNGNQPAAIPSPGGTNFTVPGQNQAGNKWKQISDGPVISAHYSDNTILFYDYSGELWQLLSGETKGSALSQSPVNNIAEIVWSNSLKSIIKSGTNQSDVNYLSSDISSKSVSNLKSGIKAIAFSPDSKKIIYQIADNLKTNILFTSDSSGKNQKTLLSPFRLRDVNIFWPKTNQISLVSKPSGLVAGSLWALNTLNLTFNKLLDGVFGLEAVWSPDGNSFIFSYTDQNGQNPKLALFDNKGNAKIFNNISTLADKCVWTKDSLNIFCAVPKSWPGSAILPDDYYKNSVSTTDDLWKINIVTSEKNLVFQNIGNISNLDINSANNSLIFILRNNGFLYQLSLD